MCVVIFVCFYFWKGQERVLGGKIYNFPTSFNFFPKSHPYKSIYIFVFLISFKASDSNIYCIQTHDFVYRTLEIYFKQI